MPNQISNDTKEQEVVSIDVHCSDSELMLMQAENVISARLTNEWQMTEISGSFLNDFCFLTCVDLSQALGGISTINNGFLAGCSSLTSLNLSGFTNVTSIGEFFLYRCSSLTAVDLGAFGRVTSIEDSFLRECTSLIDVDLSAFQNVTSIGSDLFYSCTSLTAADFTAFKQVSSIGDCFLTSCSSLVAVNLESFVNVLSIGQGFVCKCTQLAAVDLRVFANVTTIGQGFLRGCSSLTTVDLTAFKSVTCISDGFLSDCTALTTLDLTPFGNVNSIGNGFLHNCSALTALNLSAFENVKSIGDTFLFCCLSLPAVDLSPLHNVRSIGGEILTLCLALKEIIISTSSFSVAGLSLNEWHRSIAVCKAAGRADDGKLAAEHDAQWDAEVVYQTQRADEAVALLVASRSTAVEMLRVPQTKVTLFPQQRLGSGARGYVCKGLCYGAPVAVKVIPYVDESEKRELLDFAAVGALCGHPNLLPVSCWTESSESKFEQQLFLVMPLVLPGDMVTVAKSLPPGDDGWGVFGRDQILSMTLELAAALDFLADKNLVHQGVKPQNVLLRHNGTIPPPEKGVRSTPQHSKSVAFQALLSDFSHSATEVRERRRSCDSSAVVTTVTPKEDVFSLGQTMWGALLGTVDLFCSDRCVSAEATPPVDADLTAFKSLLRRMTLVDESQRPTAAEVVQEIRFLYPHHIG